MRDADSSASGGYGGGIALERVDGGVGHRIGTRIEENRSHGGAHAVDGRVFFYQLGQSVVGAMHRPG